MTTYKPGDLVLVPYPLGDPLSGKKRPALILAATDNEVVIAQVTGHEDGSPRSGDYKIVHWQQSGLLRASLVRMRFATLPTDALLRHLGSLHEDDLKATNEALRSALII